MRKTDNQLTMYEACLHHSRADRNLRLVVTRSLEKYHVTMMEWLLLGVVGSGPSTGQNMSALARQLDVTMPQVTALTSHLLEHKLVKQKAAKQDRRNRFVVITGKGKNLLDDVEDDLQKAMQDWLEPLSDEQLNQYMETVQQMSALEPVKVEMVETTIVQPLGLRRNVSIEISGES